MTRQHGEQLDEDEDVQRRLLAQEAGPVLIRHGQKQALDQSGEAGVDRWARVEDSDPAPLVRGHDLAPSIQDGGYAVEFRSAEDFGMAIEHVLQQRGTAARNAADEHQPLPGRREENVAITAGIRGDVRERIQATQRRDANEIRQGFTPSERVAITDAIKARIGQRRRGSKPRGEFTAEEPSIKGDGRRAPTTDHIAANRAGFNSRRCYLDTAAVVHNGVPELIDAMDKGEFAELSSHRATRSVRALMGKRDTARRTMTTIRDFP